MAGMGQSKAGGPTAATGRDTVVSPCDAGGQGYDHIKDPGGASAGASGGLNIVTDPGHGMPVQKQGDGSMPNEASVPDGGKLPFPALDGGLVTGGQNAKVDQGEPVRAPTNVQTSASPAGGAGHKPYRLR
jgi:hypothetical protein